MGIIGSLFGKRKEPMSIAAKIASAIDEVICVGGVALLETSIIRLGKNDGVTITTRQTLAVCETEYETKGQTKEEVYIFTLPEFKQLQLVYKHANPYPGMPKFEVESLTRMKYDAVSSLAMAVYRNINNK